MYLFDLSLCNVHGSCLDVLYRRFLVSSCVFCIEHWQWFPGRIIVDWQLLVQRHRIASLLPVLSYNLCMQKLKSKRFITFSTIRTSSSVHCPSSLSCIDLFWLCVTDWILESYNDLLIKSGTRFALGLVSIVHISAAFLCRTFSGRIRCIVCFRQDVCMNVTAIVNVKQSTVK